MANDASFEFSIDDPGTIREILETIDKIVAIKSQVIEQAVQGDGPIPRQLDVFKNDMDYACERMVLRGQVRLDLMIDTATGELV